MGGESGSGDNAFINKLLQEDEVPLNLTSWHFPDVEKIVWLVDSTNFWIKVSCTLCYWEIGWLYTHCKFSGSDRGVMMMMMMMMTMAMAMMTV